MDVVSFPRKWLVSSPLLLVLPRNRHSGFQTSGKFNNPALTKTEYYEEGMSKSNSRIEIGVGGERRRCGIRVPHGA